MKAPQWMLTAGWIGWRGELGWILIVVGVLSPCLLGGLGLNTWLPPQDATPEQLAQFNQGEHDAGVLFLIGTGIGLAVVAAGVWLIIVNRRLRRAGAPPLSPGT